MAAEHQQREQANIHWLDESYAMATQLVGRTRQVSADLATPVRAPGTWVEPAGSY